MFKSFKLSRRELNLAILSCIIVVTSFAYVIFLEPFLEKYNITKQEIQESQTKFLKLKRILLLKERIELAYSKFKPRLSQEGSDEERFALFLKEVEANSRRSNIYITSLKPVTISELDKAKEYLIRVEAEGRLDSLATFLGNLPTVKQLVGLKHIEISYLSQEEDLLQFQMTLSKMIIDRNDEE